MAATHANAETQMDEVGREDDWILVDDGELRGMNIVVDHTTGEVMKLSTRFCRDADRWKIMPALAEFPSLETLDLHNCRYLVDVDDSVGNLKSLKHLFMTRCDSLERLPNSIGRLENLQEVITNVS